MTRYVAGARDAERFLDLAAEHWDLLRLFVRREQSFRLLVLLDIQTLRDLLIASVTRIPNTAEL